MVHQFHNGLLILSRVPIDAQVLKKHARSSALERMFASKSCLRFPDKFVGDQMSGAAGRPAFGHDQVAIVDDRDLQSADFCGAYTLVSLLVAVSQRTGHRVVAFRLDTVDGRAGFETFGFDQALKTSRDGNAEASSAGLTEDSSDFLAEQFGLLREFV